MLTGFYIEGTSWVHRAQPLHKVLALFCLSTLIFWVPNLAIMAALALITLLAYKSANIPYKTVIKQLKPIWIMMLIIFLIQLWLKDFTYAIFICLRFAVLILIASLVTLTTRTSDMIEGLEKALSPFCSILPVERISLAISLTLRFIPALYAMAKDVREAQEARGIKANVFAMLVPMIVRTLKMADEIADAMEARGYDSEPSK